MKAVVIKQKSVLSIEHVPTPQAGPGEVVVEVKYCGICGSDIRLLADGYFPVGLIPGHEFCGRLSEVGTGVDGWFVGDRVTATPVVMCGTCRYCLHGQWHHCSRIKTVGVNLEVPGAFAEYVKVKAEMLHRLPGEVTDEEAASVEPCAVSLRAVGRSGIKIGNSVVIFGAGSIGLFVLQCARLAGAKSIYVIEPAQGRACAATALGADRVFDPAQVSAHVEVAKLCEDGADVAFVCTAASPSLQQAVETVRKQGRVMLVSGGGPAEVIPELWMWKEVEVSGSFSYLDEFSQALELFRQQKVKVEGMISDIVPLERAPQMFRDLVTPSSQIKVLVRPG